MYKELIKKPIMKIGLAFILVGLLPNLISAINKNVTLDIITKTSLIIGICCVLFALFKNKLDRKKRNEIKE